MGGGPIKPGQVIGESDDSVTLRKPDPSLRAKLRQPSIKDWDSIHIKNCLARKTDPFLWRNSR